MDFFRLTSIMQHKKMIIFGAGYTGRKIVSDYNIEIDYFVDNDKTKWSTKINNIPTFSPKKLEAEDKQAIFIIIAAEEWEGIKDQLIEMGFSQGQNFINNPTLVKDPVTEINNIQKILLFTSYGEDGGLFKYDCSKLKCEKIVSGNYRGIEIINDTIFVAENNEGIVQLNESYEIVDSYNYNSTNLNIHGITFDEKNNRLYVVESGRDRIGIFNINPLNRIDEIVFEPSFEDYHHLNDIWLEENVIYISMFSKSGKWKRGVFDGVILEYDLIEKKVKNTLFTGLKMPHSIKVYDSKFFYLDSLKYNFLMNGAKAGDFRGFLRGLDYDGEYFYIGQSKMRHLDRISPEVNNTNVDCGIHVFSMKDNISRFITMPTSNIYDIKLIN